MSTAAPVKETKSRILLGTVHVIIGLNAIAGGYSLGFNLRWPFSALLL